MNSQPSRYSLRPRPLQPPTRQRHLDTQLFTHLTADIDSQPLDTDNSSYTPTFSNFSSESCTSTSATESQLSEASSCDLFGLEAITASPHTPGSSILEGKRPYYNSLNPTQATYQQQVQGRVEYWTKEAIIQWARTKRPAPEPDSPPAKRRHGQNHSQP